jgi:protein phosphatase
MRSLHEFIRNSIDNIKGQGSFFRITGKLVTLPKGMETVIVGDLHGDLLSLKKIMLQTRLEGRLERGKAVLIVLGDYIDRGPQQVEVLLNLLQLLERHPDSVLLLRGNHEGPSDLVVSPQDFPEKLRQKFGSGWKPLYDCYRELFNELYTACIVQNEALLVHGGIPTEAKTTEDISVAHITHPETRHLEEVLWNDPSKIQGINVSFRGAGKRFGTDIANEFLESFGLKMLIRGHESFKDGYHFYNDRVLTIHSCKLPHYRNRKLAFLDIDEDIGFTRTEVSRFLQTLE